MAARMVQHNLHESDWSTVGKAALQSMSADAKENLEEIPDTWRASEISFFFTGRADWGLLASAFPCFWGGGRGQADHQGRPCPGARARQVEGLPARRGELSANRGDRSPSRGRLQDLGPGGQGRGENDTGVVVWEEAQEEEGRGGISAGGACLEAAVQEEHHACLVAAV